MSQKPLDYKGKTRNGAAVTIIGYALVLAANSERRLATFVNDSANWMWLIKDDAGVINTGIALAPNGGSYEINLINPYYGAIGVACAVAAQNLCWTEDE